MPRWSWGPPAGGDARRTSEEARKNTPALIAALVEARTQHARPDATLALELGAGSGEHTIALAERFPELTWLPSDPDPVQRASVAAWLADSPARARVRPALDLDAARAPWPVTEPLALVLAVHVLHMLPADALPVIVRESARLLAPGGLLVLLDSFLDDAGQASGARMRDFDRALRGRDARAGLPRRSALDAAAKAAGLGVRAEVAYEGDQVIWVGVRG